MSPMVQRLLTACLALTALLSGCIIFDKKSEAVTFHQLASPAAVTTRSGPTLFVPRAIIPSALRRPNVVLIDDTGWVRIEDAHRWISPLDRAVPEAVGRHLTSLALDWGHEVTLYNRGHRQHPDWRELTQLQGDRDQSLDPLLGEGLHWDLTIDTCCYDPAQAASLSTASCASIN